MKCGVARPLIKEKKYLDYIHFSIYSFKNEVYNELIEIQYSSHRLEKYLTIFPFFIIRNRNLIIPVMHFL